MSIDVNIEVGKNYGKLIVTKFLYFRNYKKSRQPIYECKCECGKLIEIGLWSLRKSGKLKKSCGCEFSKLKSLSEGEAAFRKIYRVYKESARKRKYEFNLNELEFREIITSNCHYCFSPPDNVSNTDNNTGTFIYNGIDRKDNDKGYSIENCVPCCQICNRAKSTMNYDDFVNWTLNFCR